LSHVKLLATDPDLLALVEDPARRHSARGELVVDELTVDAGQQVDAAAVAQTGGLGVLILSGYVSRELAISDRVAAELTGPEDLLCASYMVPGEELLPFSVRWSALVPTKLALLDREFTERVSRWPEIVYELVERARRPGDRAAFAHVIARLPTVDARLLTSLWHWASSWSTVTSDGVRLAVPLSHERLARLVGARRPTVTAAVGRLRDAGYIQQLRDCSWLLFSPSANLGAGNAQPGVAAPALDGILDTLAYRGRVHVPNSRGTTSAQLAELHARLAEQRELLRLASDRHQRQLSRLRDRSDRLRATTQLAALARVAREVAGNGRSGEGDDAVAEEGQES
jgi:CRP/FNR family transcriptional regulator, cyclic AMP receptor protein